MEKRELYEEEPVLEKQHSLSRRAGDRTGWGDAQGCPWLSALKWTEKVSVCVGLYTSIGIESTTKDNMTVYQYISVVVVLNI